jgi:hypothetical protein
MGATPVRPTSLRSDAVDVNDGLGKRLRRLLRWVVSDAARLEPVCVLAGERLGVRSGVGMWRKTRCPLRNSTECCGQVSWVTSRTRLFGAEWTRRRTTEDRASAGGRRIGGVPRREVVARAIRAPRRDFHHTNDRDTPLGDAAAANGWSWREGGWHPFRDRQDLRAIAHVARMECATFLGQRAQKRLELARGRQVRRRLRNLQPPSECDKHLQVVNATEEILGALESDQVGAFSALARLQRKLHRIAELLQRDSDIVQTHGIIERPSGIDSVSKRGSAAGSPRVNGPQPRLPGDGVPSWLADASSAGLSVVHGLVDAVSQPAQFREWKFRRQSLSRRFPLFLHYAGDTAQRGRRVLRVAAQVLDEEYHDVQFTDGTQLSRHSSKTAIEFPCPVGFQSDERNDFTEPARGNASLMQRFDVRVMDEVSGLCEGLESLMKGVVRTH